MLSTYCLGHYAIEDVNVRKFSVLALSLASLAFPAITYACGMEFYAAYDMQSNQQIASNPNAFTKQVQVALEQCAERVTYRSTHGESNALDAAFEANRKNCGEMGKAMEAAKIEASLPVAFCLFSAMQNYAWSILVEPES